MRRPCYIAVLWPLTAQSRDAQKGRGGMPHASPRTVHTPFHSAAAQHSSSLHRTAPASPLSAQVQQTVSQVAVAAGLNSDVVVQAVGRTGAAITQLQQAGGRATALFESASLGHV